MFKFLKNNTWPGIVLLSACQSVPSIPESPPRPVVTAAVETPVKLPTEMAAPEPVIDINRLNYEAAIEDLKLGQVDIAIEELEYLTKIVPELDFLFTNLGLAYLKIGRYEPAEQAFERAISQNNFDAVAYNHLGIVTRLRGKFVIARKNYEKAISIDDKYAPAHLNLGILFDIYLQDLNQALGQYQKFQSLTNNENKTVAGWIIDIERRLKSGQQS